MYILEFTKKIINTLKLDRELRALNSKYNSLTIKNEYLQLMFSSALSQEEINSVSSLIGNFVEIDVVDDLKVYIEKEVRPFVDDTMYKIKAENIVMGITQMGKTIDILGFFNEKITLPGKTRGVSIKEALSDDSLYAVVELMNYYINNPSLYSDLSPFVTVERLTQWRDKVLDFLT